MPSPPLIPFVNSYSVVTEFARVDGCLAPSGQYTDSCMANSHPIQVDMSAALKLDGAPALSLIRPRE